MKKMLLKLAAVSAVVLLSACADKAPPPSAPVASNPPPAAPSIRPGSVQDFQTNVGDTVHFDYDKYDLDATDRDTLQKQATWLGRYAAVTLTIEGHCDERGTREYNIALGARRAAAVKEYLVSLGVASSRLETISYGKERPICAESNESCWAQNRRGVSTIKSGAAS